MSVDPGQLVDGSGDPQAGDVGGEKLVVERVRDNLGLGDAITVGVDAVEVAGGGGFGIGGVRKEGVVVEEEIGREGGGGVVREMERRHTITIYNPKELWGKLPNR